MIPSFSLHAHAPWAIMPDRLTEGLAALGSVSMENPLRFCSAAERPKRKPVYKYSEEDGGDMADDWSLAAQHNNARLMLQKVGPNTAVLQIKGMILKDCPFECWLYGYATPLNLVDLALDMVAEGGFTNLILDCNSPGGSCLGLLETADRIKMLSTRGVHTTAYTSSLCASAMYYLASACQEIFASPTAIVGSIGTYSVFTDYSKAADMAGLKFEVFVARAAPLKAAGETGSLTDAQRTEMQRHVDEADSLFQAQVKSSRRRLNLEEASTGAWWHAASSPKGLVDDAKTFYSLNDLISVLAS